MTASRPPFRSTATESAPESVEALWPELRGKRQHEYLRGPQQDVIRKYDDEGGGRKNVAIELPTGSGKTTVGLLIAEWWRRKTGKAVAYLTVTNQLAHQVLEESARLGLNCANVTGRSATRDPAEEGRYRTGSAVGVSTYSNLFNVNPVIKNPDLVILDDVHGGESYVSDMWTLQVNQAETGTLYRQLLQTLIPSMSDRQRRALAPGAAADTSSLDHLIHIPSPEALTEFTKAMDGEELRPEHRFPWQLLRDRLSACVVIASRESIVVRPTIPPTWTHAPFSEATQRVYLSATLGAQADLQRAYGIESPLTLKAEHAGSGRRFIFAPEMYTDDFKAIEVVTSVWQQMVTKRALVLAPSNGLAHARASLIADSATPNSRILDATDISESLLTFTESSNVVLALGGRYDGIDLPHDHCRLSVMAGSPSAITAFERHLRDQWRTGPALDGRLQTRLVQGLGRCTRSDNDFSIVFWLGSRLVNVLSNPNIIDNLPSDIRAELMWGRNQTEVVAESPDSFVSMVVGLMTDGNYRAEAEAALQDAEEKLPSSSVDPVAKALGAVVSDELRFAQHMWESYAPGAYKAARSVADRLHGDALSGYRAWWWYLAATAAVQSDDNANAQDCLERAVGCGVNLQFLDAVARAHLPEETGASSPLEQLSPTTEGIWDYLEGHGWAGGQFERATNELLTNIAEDAHTRFHMGVEALGNALGFRAIRPIDEGTPDIVWSAPGDRHIAFEAKSEKKATSSLSKSDVQKANGHVDWVRERLAEDEVGSSITALLASRTTMLREASEPHVGDLRVTTPEALRDLAAEVIEFLEEQRYRLAGKGFAEAGPELSAALEARRLDMTSIMTHLTETRLADTSN